MVARLDSSIQTSYRFGVVTSRRQNS